MPEKMLEKKFCFEQKNEGKKNNPKYPLDIVTNKNEAINYENNLTNKEIIKLLKFLYENGYNKQIDLLKNCANKSGFKKIAISPFDPDFHVVPSYKENTCFVPVKSIPRIKNLQEIFPELAEKRTELIIEHERQHCHADALTAHKNRINKDSDDKVESYDTESLANQQKIIRTIEKENNARDINIFSSLAKEFVYVKIIACGAQVLELDYMEKEAKKWLKYEYLFDGNMKSVEKFGDKRNVLLEEYINAKKKIRTGEFYDLFLEEFRKCKKEVLEKYNQHIKENNVPDFYDKEDRECESLRIKIINCLNQEKII